MAKLMSFRTKSPSQDVKNLNRHNVGSMGRVEETMRQLGRPKVRQNWAWKDPAKKVENVSHTDALMELLDDIKIEPKRVYVVKSKGVIRRAKR